MGPGRLTGMNGARSRQGARRDGCFNGARSIDRDERRGPSAVLVPREELSMGPGRLTGMNGSACAGAWRSRAGFNGARSIDRDERRTASALGLTPCNASMGPGRLTGMNVARAEIRRLRTTRLQWGPVD